MDFRLPALLVCGLLLGFGDLPAQQQSTATTARSKGSPRAPVTVYEMSDFQCPYCRSFALETFRALEKEYISPGKVRWVFVNFPLTSIHANAVAAAGTALCAGKQDAFWPVHDLLYTYQDTWAPATESEIRYEAEGAERAGASSTPTFYIEGGLLTGAHPLPVFRQVLDSVYAEKTRRAPTSK